MLAVLLRCNSFQFKYASYIPVLLVQVKSYKDLLHFETAYVVKLHSVARLSPCQPVSFLPDSMLFFMSWVVFIFHASLALN